MKSRRLIIPSFRGHDGTDWILPEAYGVGTSDLDDFVAVLDAEGLERIDVVGHSSGGATAFALARLFPDRVGRLILIEPTLLALLPPLDYERLAADIWKIIEFGESGEDGKAFDATMEFAGGEGWRQMNDEDKTKRISRIAHMVAFLGPHFRGLLDFGVTPTDLKNLRPPALLIYGEKSMDFESLIAASWRDHRPDVRQVWVAGAGHNSHAERPEIVTPAIVNFLNATG